MPDKTPTDAHRARQSQTSTTPSLSQSQLSNADCAIFFVQSLQDELARANHEPSNPNSRPGDIAAQQKQQPAAAAAAAAAKAPSNKSIGGAVRPFPDPVNSASLMLGNRDTSEDMQALTAATMTGMTGSIPETPPAKASMSPYTSISLSSSSSEARITRLHPPK